MHQVKMGQTLRLEPSTKHKIGRANGLTKVTDRICPNFLCTVPRRFSSLVREVNKKETKCLLLNVP